jgi:hypothetical protein
MKQIIQINEALKAKYKVVDAENAIGKIYFDGQTKSNKMGVFLYDSRIYPFTPDESYDIQVCHYLTSGRSNNDSKYAEMDFTVELIVISKFVKFYHVMDILHSLNISFSEYNPNTLNILKQIGAVEDYPELEAYSIRYTFRAKPSDFLNC